MKILVVGCGSMGGAMIRGWLASTSSMDSLEIYGIAPHPEHVGLEDVRLQLFTHPDQLPHTAFDLIVFAVKPYVLDKVLPLYKKISGLKTSVAAGKMMPFYEAFFPGEAFLRIMPNTPVAIGAGALLVHGNDYVEDSDLQHAQAVLGVLGEVFWLEDESQFNAGTAVTGCGPAYFFLLAEYLQKEAEALGFSAEQARKMSKATLKGSALYASASVKSLEDLRYDVARPGGMTEQAVRVLQSALEKTMGDALKAAMAKGEELSK